MGEYWHLVAELVTPVLISGRLFAYQGILWRGSFYEQYLINLLPSGSAFVYLYLGAQGYPFIPTYGPFVPD